MKSLVLVSFINTPEERQASEQPSKVNPPQCHKHLIFNLNHIWVINFKEPIWNKTPICMVVTATLANVFSNTGCPTRCLLLGSWPSVAL